MIVDSELGEIIIRGYMEQLEPNPPIWGIFTGIMHTHMYDVPCTLHFKDTEGIIEVDLPIFKIDFMIHTGTAWIAFGLLDDTPVALTQVLGAPWSLGGCGITVGSRHGQLIVAFAL